MRKKRSFTAKKVISKTRADTKIRVFGNLTPSGVSSPFFRLNRAKFASRKLRPFILTCNNRLDTFKEFINSYNKIKHNLLQPIVFVSYNHFNTREIYDEMLASLNPYIVVEQGKYYENEDMKESFSRLSSYYRHKAYLNTQKVMTKDFPALALEYTNSDEDILFMEDDVLFSSQFPVTIGKVSEYLQAGCDFLTLYSPKKGYKTLTGLPQDEFIHPIDGASYYGNICVAFKRDTIKFLARNWKKVEASSTAWDCRWGISLKEAGYRLYATRNSYVQHQTGYSALEQKYKKEFSKVFVR